MKAESGLKVIDQDGTELNVLILKPFLETIAPAVGRDADEITMRLTHSHPDDLNVRLQYRKDGRWHALTTHIDLSSYNALVTVSRLRIISGISILREKTQKGQTCLRLGASRLTFAVEITQEDDGKGETVTLRLQEKRRILE